MAEIKRGLCVVMLGAVSLVLGCPEADTLTGLRETPVPVATATPKPTAAPLATPTPRLTATPVPTGSPSATLTPVLTASPVRTETATATATPHSTATSQATATRVNTRTRTATALPTLTATPTVTETPTFTPTPTRTATPLPTWTPTTPGPPVYASGVARSTRFPNYVVGAVVTVDGTGIHVSTSSGSNGQWQLPPFPSNIPITLHCSKSGYIQVGRFPPAGYVPLPGTYTDWNCTLLPRFPEP